MFPSAADGMHFIFGLNNKLQKFWRFNEYLPLFNIASFLWCCFFSKAWKKERENVVPVAHRMSAKYSHKNCKVAVTK